MTLQDLLKPLGAVDMPLSEAVYQAVKTVLRSGDVPPETRLVETDIATRLGVSRTPVREAMRRLQADGLIEPTASRGFVLVDLLADAEESFQIRQRLEGLAAYRAARKISAPELEDLQALQEEMEVLISKPEVDPAELTTLNIKFHEAITEAACSERLRQLISQFTVEYVARRVVELYGPDERAASISHHRQILDALWERNAERAEELAMDHIAMGQRVVFERLRHLSPAHRSSS